MSIALDLFCFPIPFTMIFPAVLSVTTGVGGCGRTIYARAVRMNVAFCQFSKNPPNSVSVDDEIPFIMILHSTCNGPFYWGISVISGLLLDFGLIKTPPALLRASGSDM